MRIGIIGAGFSGTALAANLRLYANTPTEITLFDKSGQFGAGPAYSTPYSYHLLNVRAKDMSAFTHDPQHFVNWLTKHPHQDNYSESYLTLADQFAPRQLYGEYLQQLLQEMQQPGHACHVKQEAAEVIAVKPEAHQVRLILQNSQSDLFDKVIVAIGNNPAANFPFPVASDIHCIANPWDYCAVTTIPRLDPVLILGTGLSMIDAVLTLHHHGHRGPIHVLSRHGLLPLPHTHVATKVDLSLQQLPKRLQPLTKAVRALCEKQMQEGGDWRDVIQAFRLHLPNVWQASTNTDKMRFLRHILPYWNIHRHRVHTRIMDLLTQLQEEQQLTILSGRVLSVSDGKAVVQPRHTTKRMEIPCRTLINCMGPTQQLRREQQPLINSLLEQGLATLDALQLGFAVDANGALMNHQAIPSSSIYSLGSPTKGATWEISAVPEIRKQIAVLVQHLLA